MAVFSQKVGLYPLEYADGLTALILPNGLIALTEHGFAYEGAAIDKKHHRYLGGGSSLHAFR